MLKDLNRRNAMTATYPPQGQSYLGPITDTSRWTHFQHRPDDIFVCTPPKCGTTWTQAICAMLVFGAADHGEQPGMISPWIDAAFAPIEDYLKQVDAQPHRRFIKTHTPFDGIPYFSTCPYLVVFRDPRDVYISSLNHRDNMTDQELAHRVLPSGPNPFQNWLTQVREPGAWDLYSLDSFVHFFNTYWPYRHLDNVHIFHYADMKRDLRGAIAAMAAALGVTLSDQQLTEFTKAASFDHMKRNAGQYAPELGRGFWKEDAQFFANGVNEQWKVHLSAEELAAFDVRIAELLPPDQLNWVLNGNG
jgi:aryl sulfotransferase